VDQVSPCKWCCGGYPFGKRRLVTIFYSGGYPFGEG